MNNSKVLLQDFIRRLSPAEDPDELHAIGLLVFEHLYGLSRTAIMAGQPIPDPQPERLEAIITRLGVNEPIQYILGEAHFYGRTYHVNRSVLIPRPETEELVKQVIDFAPNAPKLVSGSILDIGTGSGCIAVTLALELKGWNVYATDISKDALEVAGKNSKRYDALVAFYTHDIITERIPLQTLSAIVSNPPYITIGERASMKPNVLAFEPHLALFVENHDPLLFYRAISHKAQGSLLQGGMIAFEINAGFGQEVARLLHTDGFTNVSILNDLQGKPRIVKGFLA
jgi:release factor glutamine methyltransferase